MLTLSGTLSTFKSKWQNAIGITFSNHIDLQKKYGFFWNSRVKLWDNGDLGIRIEQNISQSNFSDNNFNEFIAQMTLEVRMVDVFSKDFMLINSPSIDEDNVSYIMPFIPQLLKN